MTVEAATNKAGPYNVTGTSGTFARPFLIRDAAHLRVIRLRDGDEADLTSGITHTGINTADGSVSITAGLQAGDVIYLLRDVPNVQASDYNAQGRVRPDQIEIDLDLAAMQIQDLREAQGRALTLPVSSELSGEEALDAAVRAPEFATSALLAAERAERAAAGIAPNFAIRSALSAAADLVAGQRAYAGGIGYIVDPTAIGMASALWDIGLDGFTAPDRPVNAYISAFHDLNTPRVIRLYSSTDGRAWRLLNTLPLEADGAEINGGNPVICWRDGWFYLLVSFTIVGSVDFRIYKTRDFTSFQQFDCTAGPSALSSSTVAAPGGATVPANEIWGADMSFDANGALDVFVTVPFSTPVTDAYGITAGNRRTYRTRCTNLDTMTFGAPVLEGYPAGHPPRTFQFNGTSNVAPTLPLNHLAIRAAGDAGLDVSFAELFTSAFPRDNLLFIPCGKGGSGFSNSEWTAGGAAYTAAVARIQAALAANPNAIVEGVLWHQGEADRNFAAYPTQLASLINRLRTDVPQLAGKPFVLGEIGRFVSGGSVDVNAVINAIPGTIANTAVVSSLGMTDRGDALHFDSSSYRTMGARYWDRFKALRGSVGSGSTARTRIIIIAGQSNSVGHWPYAFPSVIDASQTRTPTGYVHSVKDEILKRIRIYTRTTATGPLTFQEMLSNDTYKIEGSAIVPRRLSDGSVRWDLFVEGHDTIEGNVRSTRMMVYPGGETPTGWGAPEFLQSTRGIRHGTPLNLGFEDPAAAAAFQRIGAAATGDSVAMTATEQELLSGNRTIVPQEGQIYYVTGTTSTRLTVLDGPADHFYVACLSANPAAGVVVLGAEAVPSECVVGYGLSNDRLVRFTRRSNGRYLAEVGSGGSAFVANKGGTPQTVPAVTATVVTFASEEFDAGGRFSGSQWTPAPGLYRLCASIMFFGSTPAATNSLRIRKNGVAVRQVQELSQDGTNTLAISCLVQASGTDTFDVAVSLGGSGDKTIVGGEANTWFEGAPA